MDDTLCTESAMTCMRTVKIYFDSFRGDDTVGRQIVQEARDEREQVLVSDTSQISSGDVRSMTL